MSLLSVQAAQKRILSLLESVEPENLPLTECTNRVLAEDIAAAADLPPFDNSAMDGFAVRSADVAAASPASPRTLRVVADIAAGAAPEASLAPGQAARITTGAPLPKGADAVVPVEDTDFNERAPGTPAPGQVQVFRPVATGGFVRSRGMDARAGQVVLAKGRRLRPQDIGLMAMLGMANVSVHRKPRVALLSSGDELLPLHQPLTAGKIHDSNSYALAAQVESAGAECIRLGIAADTRAAITSLLEQAVTSRADLILSSAGVSVGAYDFVKEAVEAHGQLNFWRVNMRPGKPLAFGNYRGVPFFGLPGNPVSAFVTFEVFARAAIERLSGMTGSSRPRARVRLEEAVESDGRESYLRAVVRPADGILSAHLTGHQGSGNLLSLVQANALLIVPAGVKSLPAGREVEAWLL